MTTALAPTTAGLAFRVEPKPFASAIAFVAKHLPSRPQVPVLAGLLLDVADGQVTVAGFDYDVATRAQVQAFDAAPGRVLVSGRLLSELVKTLPDKPVDVAVADNKLTLRCGSIRLGLPLMNVDDYPTLPAEPPAVGTAAAADLAALIERVGLAADRTGSGGIKGLYGIHLTFGADQLAAMATDRYRAADGSIPWQAGDTATGTGEALVPAQLLIDATRALDHAGDITIGADTHLVSLTAPGRSLISRQLAEEFPAQAMKTLMPARAAEPAIIPVAEVAVALKRADLVREPRTPVLLTLTNGQVAVGARSDADADDAIDCQYDGPDMTVGFNPDYLADALAGLRSDTAELSITDPIKPVLLTAPGDTGQTYRHLVVPIRTAR